MTKTCGRRSISEVLLQTRKKCRQVENGGDISEKYDREVTIRGVQK